VSSSEPADNLATLRSLATRSSASEINVSLLKEVLEQGKDDFWKADEAVEAAIQNIVKHLEGLEKGEEFIKGYQIISHNSMGKEQERLLILTTHALYRVNYTYKDGSIKSSDREPWANIELIQFGQFYYSKGMLPSVGQFILSQAIDNLYGMRIFYKNKPDKVALPIPILVEKFVDQCFRTYRPMVDAKLAAVEGDVAAESDGKLSSPAQAFMEKVTQEMVWVALALHRVALATEQPYLQPYSDTKIAVNATHGVVAAVHNGLDMGISKDRTAAVEPAPAKDDKAPAKDEKASAKA